MTKIKAASCATVITILVILMLSTVALAGSGNVLAQHIVTTMIWIVLGIIGTIAVVVLWYMIYGWFASEP